MANAITLSILLTICIFSSVYSAPTGSPALQVVIYHPESESLVRASHSQVAADGTTGDSYTKFFWDQENGSFESVDLPGKYLLMDAAGALSLGVPNEPTFKHRYTRTSADVAHDYLTAVTSSGSTCYIAFDWQGAQLASPCDPLSGVDEQNAKIQITFP